MIYAVSRVVENNKTVGFGLVEPFGKRFWVKSNKEIIQVMKLGTIKIANLTIVGRKYLECTTANLSDMPMIDRFASERLDNDIEYLGDELVKYEDISKNRCLHIVCDSLGHVEKMNDERLYMFIASGLCWNVTLDNSGHLKYKKLDSAPPVIITVGGLDNHVEDLRHLKSSIRNREQ